MLISTSRPRRAWHCPCPGILSFEQEGRLRGNWQSFHPASAKMAFCSSLRRLSKAAWLPISSEHSLSCTKEDWRGGIRGGCGREHIEGSTQFLECSSIQLRVTESQESHHGEAGQGLGLLLVPLIKSVCKQKYYELGLAGDFSTCALRGYP